MTDENKKEAPQNTELKKMLDKLDKEVDPGNGIRILNAAEKSIPRYRREDLKDVLPSKYYKLISGIAPADLNGDPDVELISAHLVYSLVTFVRDLGDSHPFLKDAEITERTLVAVAGEKRAKGK